MIKLVSGANPIANSKFAEQYVTNDPPMPIASQKQ